MLVLCGACERHVKEGAAQCPFCGAANTARGVRAPVRRMSRALMATSSVVMACSSASLYGGVPAYGGPFTTVCSPPFGVVITAPCGFLEVTGCTGAAATCSGSADGLSTTCSIGPFTQDCVLSITTGDLAKHTVPVTVDPRMYESCGPAGAVGDLVTSPTTTQDFASATCVTPRDAGIGDGSAEN